ncbi:hypothetical protein [Natrinema salinisoli]|uniref:hypothetical protein n=1 Tax=Natrinema salinisoli TaxID=2878535 RepID=UPI001CF05213|nr:hypothetical protein [Natrinema salinisoli]
MPGVTFDRMAKIRHNRSTLHRLPAPGVRWRWGDVVDDYGDGDDAKVSKKDAYAVKPLLRKVDDGVYETTERLAEYLDDMWGIEVGANGGAGQSRLPVETAVTGESRTLTDGSGSPPDSGGERRQAALDGSDATADVRAVAVQEDPRVIGAYKRNPSPKHDTAAQDAGQAGLDAFTVTGDAGAVPGDVDAFTVTEWVGRFRRPTGNVYA